MKKILLIAILVLAIGGILYYFKYEQSGNSPDQSSFSKMLLGSWKIDTVVSYRKDTTVIPELLALAANNSFKKYECIFGNDGSIKTKIGDSTVPIILKYALKDSTTLVIEGGSLTSAVEMKITSLDENSFTVLSPEGTSFRFQKQK